MLQLRAAIRDHFVVLLQRKQILQQQYSYYLRWLRYYLDFCHKYEFPDSNPQSLEPFLNKLQQKNQTVVQLRQASEAVSLFYELNASGSLNASTSGFTA